MFKYLFPLFCLITSSSFAATYYVATNGLPANPGTLAQPWDLWTAGHKTATLIAGDLVFLRGGGYTNAPQGYITNTFPGSIFEFTVSGGYTNLITFMPYNGEHVTIDGLGYGGPFAMHNANDSPTGRPTLRVGSSINPNVGRFLRFVNLEIMSSTNESRFTTDDSAFPTNRVRGDGVYIYGRSNEFINCVVHDLGTGFSPWGDSGGTRLYGNVDFNNGWQSSHAHGHNIYTQNFTNSAPKYIHTNFLFNAYDKNYQAYGSSSAFVCHYRIFGNYALNSDTLLGGRTSVVIFDNQIQNQYHYNSDLVFIYDYGNFYGDAIICNNFIDGGRLQGGAWQSMICTNNTVVSSQTNDVFDLITSPIGNVLTNWVVNRNYYYSAPFNPINTLQRYFHQEGFAPMDITNWHASVGYELNSVVYNHLPTTNLTVLQPNYYDLNRGHLVVYNYSLASFLTITNVSGTLGWSASETVLVRNVEDYYADTTISVLSGGNLTVDMRASSHSIAIPRGDSVPIKPLSYPNFGMFVLEKTTPTATNTLTISSVNPASGVDIQISPADLSGLTNGTTPILRNYINSETVMLNTNGVISNKTFSLWQRAGTNYSSSPLVSTLIDGNITMSIIYTNNATNTLTITSSAPSSGIIVTNSPADQGGLTQVTTSGTLQYFYNTPVTLIAPLMSQVTNNFLKWTKNGLDFSGNTTIMFTTSSNDIYNVVYSPPVPAGTNGILTISRRRPL